MIVKITTLTLIILCCGYIGLAKQYCYKNRVNQLLLCEKLLVNIKIIIKSGNAKTKNIFFLLSKNTSFNEFDFIRNTSLMLETNCDFPTVFREELQQSNGKLDLIETDYIPLYSLCDIIGSCETDEVISGLDFAIFSVKTLQNEAKESLETNGYLTGKLGFWIGLFICILIV